MGCADTVQAVRASEAAVTRGGARLGLEHLVAQPGVDRSVLHDSKSTHAAQRTSGRYRGSADRPVTVDCGGLEQDSDGGEPQQKRCRKWGPLPPSSVSDRCLLSAKNA